MRVIAIYPNTTKENWEKDTNTVKTLCEEMGIKTKVVFGQHRIPPAAEMIITLGGDGTMMRCAVRNDSHNIPILGINTGTLGFMTGLSKLADENLELLTQILQGEYEISERSMLGVAYKNERKLALCDAWVRTSDSAAVKIGVYIDGKEFQEYSCDGVLAASPTGSTAYNLASGGIPLHPTNNALCVTALNAMGFKPKAFSISDKETVVFKMHRTRRTRVYLSVDGVTNTKREHILRDGDSVAIQKAMRVTRIVHPRGGPSFYDILKEKLK